jgi:hypothetical protein
MEILTNKYLINFMQNQKNNIKLKVVEYVENYNIYDCFINWVSAEFDLFLQYQTENLNVFFPTGEFIIKKKGQLKNQFKIEIIVESKTKETTTKMMCQINRVFKHVIDFHKNK